MHLSENTISLQEIKVEGPLTILNTSTANVEFVLLPYYKCLEEIPNKDQVYNSINSFISSTNENSTIAILLFPL